MRASHSVSCHGVLRAAASRTFSQMMACSLCHGIVDHQACVWRRLSRRDSPKLPLSPPCRARPASTPADLEIDNSPFTWDADGAVTGAGIADLDTDGSPEIYVFVTSTDAAARGSVVAFSGNKRKSPSSIYLPPMAETPAAAQGYRGHDDFAVV